jgi:hypothetical protein
MKAGVVAQVIEHLSSKHESLSSNHTTIKQTNKQTQTKDTQ